MLEAMRSSPSSTSRQLQKAGQSISSCQANGYSKRPIRNLEVNPLRCSYARHSNDTTHQASLNERRKLLRPVQLAQEANITSNARDTGLLFLCMPGSWRQSRGSQVSNRWMSQDGLIDTVSLAECDESIFVYRVSATGSSALCVRGRLLDGLLSRGFRGVDCFLVLRGEDRYRIPASGCMRLGEEN
jgi:hypothetical protein